MRALSHRLALLAAPFVVVLLLLATGCAGEQQPAEPAPATTETTATSTERGAGLTLRLPTDNDALLRGNREEFYQGLDVTVPGLRPFRWMGGQYGFVRNVAPTPLGNTFTRLHQGIDIRPVHRDQQGAPLDTVRAIADGTVAYVNPSAGRSSYGIYAVLRHDWDDSPVFSLVAHLSSVNVTAGTVVTAGTPLGRMGYTGAGLARHRAHVHLEIAFLINEHYQLWHDAYYGSQNPHGAFFGRNLVGVNPSELYLALEEEPGLTFREFVDRRPVAYRMVIPGQFPLNVLERYPWLAAEGVSPGDTDPRGAWLVSFTREGVPVEIARQAQPVAEPQVVYVSDKVQRNHLSTAGILARGTDGYRLSRDGRAYAALLATTSDGVPPWF